MDSLALAVLTYAFVGFVVSFLLGMLVMWLRMKAKELADRGSLADRRRIGRQSGASAPEASPHPYLAIDSSTFHEHHTQTLERACHLR